MPSSIIDLSHVVHDGLVTYPGLPVPVIADHLTREAAEVLYGPGVTFQIGLVTMCTNTGTYLDVPFHRFADGHDIAQLQLERVAGVDGVLIDARGRQSIELSDDETQRSAGRAVLILTGHSRHFGRPEYLVDHPHLTEASAAKLVDVGAIVVGIDSLNIDSTDDWRRPVHTTLLGAGIPIVEHLTNLDSLPPAGFRFTAVPPKIAGVGTFSVRAFATV